MSFINTLFEPTLLVFTVPVLLAVLFWLLAIVGMFDFEAFDLDLDFDGDVDVDVDLDADVAGGGGFLQLLGLGMIPFSLMFTLLLFFFGWSGIALHALTGGGSNLLFIPIALLAGLGISAGAARLLHPLFKDYGQATGARALVGKVAILKSSTVSPTFGSAEVNVDGDRFEIAVRSDTEANTLAYGSRVLIYDYDEQRRLYLVAAHDEEPV